MMADNPSTRTFVRHPAQRVRKIPNQSLRFYRQRGVELGFDKRDRAKIAFAISLKRLAQIVELARLRLGGDARR